VSIAELHGKLSGDDGEGRQERSEDLLTSSIFEIFRYAGWQCGLHYWLRDAEPVWNPVADLWAGSVKRFAYSFWPRLKNNCEPDLAVLILYEDRAPLLLLIEVKYLAGMSDWDGDGLDDLGRTGNQLIDQIAGLDCMTDPELLDWFAAGLDETITDNSARALHLPDILEPLRRVHLLLTADSIVPKIVYATAREKQHNNSTTPAYWLSWRSLNRHLRLGMQDADPCKAAACLDAHRLLGARNLLPFKGFQMAPWNRPGLRTFWQRKQWWRWPTPSLPTTGFWGR
jgi:hypothetical protein